MKLYCSTLSPFARKVRIAASELGLADQVEIVPIMVAPGKANEQYASTLNPLRRVPTLTLADGSSLSDSSVICEYLDSLVPTGGLFPRSGDQRWAVLTTHSIANGLMELSVQLRYETVLRPEAARWPEWIADHWDKINSGLAWYEQRGVPQSGTMDIGRIALACELGYLDFRFPDYAWRDQYPGLAAWHADIARRPSYRDTAPQA